MKKIFLTTSILFISLMLLIPIISFAAETPDPTGQGGQQGDTGTGGQTQAIKCECPYDLINYDQQACTDLDGSQNADCECNPTVQKCGGDVWAVFANTQCSFSNVISALQLSGLTQAGNCSESPSTAQPIDVAPVETPPAPTGPTAPEALTLPNFLASTPGEEVDVNEVIGRIVKAIIGFSGSAALAVFIYGGAIWMFSGGNPDKVAKGKKAMTYAVIGLVVIFLSYTLVFFVLKALRG